MWGAFAWMFWSMHNKSILHKSCFNSLRCVPAVALPTVTSDENPKFYYALWTSILVRNWQRLWHSNLHMPFWNCLNVSQPISTNSFSACSTNITLHEMRSHHDILSIISLSPFSIGCSFGTLKDPVKRLTCLIFASRFAFAQRITTLSILWYLHLRHSVKHLTTGYAPTICSSRLPEQYQLQHLTKFFYRFMLW